MGSGVTTCQYIATFTTKAGDTAWADGVIPEITNLGGYNLTLNWPQASADSSCDYYKVFQNGEYLDTLDTLDNTSYNVDGLVPERNIHLLSKLLILMIMKRVA